MSSSEEEKESGSEEEEEEEEKSSGEEKSGSEINESDEDKSGSSDESSSGKKKKKKPEKPKTEPKYEPAEIPISVSQISREVDFLSDQVDSLLSSFRSNQLYDIGINQFGLSKYGQPYNANQFTTSSPSMIYNPQQFHQSNQQLPLGQKQLSPAQQLLVQNQLKKQDYMSNQASQGGFQGFITNEQFSAKNEEIQAQFETRSVQADIPQHSQLALTAVEDYKHKIEREKQTDNQQNFNQQVMYNESQQRRKQNQQVQFAQPITVKDLYQNKAKHVFDETEFESQNQQEIYMQKSNQLKNKSSYDQQFKRDTSPSFLKKANPSQIEQAKHILLNKY